MRLAGVVPGGVVLVAGVVGAALGGSVAGAAQGTTTTVTFAYTGSQQSFTVPAGVTSLSVTATGAAGGVGGGEVTGGAGAVASDVVSVTPGTVYTVEVGGTGGAAGASTNNGGFNGGGSGGIEWVCRRWRRRRVGRLYRPAPPDHRSQWLSDCCCWRWGRRRHG